MTSAQRATPGSWPRRPGRSILRLLAVGATVGLLGTSVMAGSASATARAPEAPLAVARPTTADAAPGAGGGLEPTIQYEDAMAHAADRIDFAPGATVSVPFRPRASDRWLVERAHRTRQVNRHR